MVYFRATGYYLYVGGENMENLTFVWQLVNSAALIVIVYLVYRIFKKLK